VWNDNHNGRTYAYAISTIFETNGIDLNLKTGKEYRIKAKISAPINIQET
jgi:hypothetical protein